MVEMIQRNPIKQEADDAYMKHVLATAEGVGVSVFNDIQHQVNKYGAQRVDGFGWLAVIGEEMGEVFQAFLKQDWDECKNEALQTIACLSRLITEVERIQQGIDEAEADWYERAQ